MTETATTSSDDGPYVCAQCGHRQPTTGACTRCHEDGVLDLRRANTRELLADIDLRLLSKAEGIARAAAVAGSMVVVIALWFIIPNWGAIRARAFALPMFADQVILMILVALGILKLVEAKLHRPRFPYLDTLPPPTA